MPERANVLVQTIIKWSATPTLDRPSLLVAKRVGGLIEEALSSSVIGAFYEVYNHLGEGFVEHVYACAMERELMSRGHRVAREFGAIVYYKGEELTCQRLDMVVDERLVLEIKATRKLDDGATCQLFNYLRATNLEVGLLLHFGREARFFRIVCSNNKDARNPRPR